MTRLAALAADDVDDLLGAVDERVAEAEESLAALLDREDAPRRLRLLRARDGASDVVSAETRTSPRSSPVAGA